MQGIDESARSRADLESNLNRRTRPVVRLAAKAALVLVVLTMVLGPVGCGKPVVEFFPVLAETAQGYPLSSARGRLVVEGGCLRLRSLLPAFGFFFGPSQLLIWPNAYTTRIDGQSTLVLDGKGTVVARVGQIIYVGGGQITREAAATSIEGNLPDSCHGPYWMVNPHWPGRD